MDDLSDVEWSHSSLENTPTIPSKTSSRLALSDITNSTTTPPSNGKGKEGDRSSPFANDVSPICSVQKSPSTVASPAPGSAICKLRMQSYLSTPVRNLPRYISELQQTVARSNKTISTLHENMRQAIRRQENLERKNAFLEKAYQRQKLRAASKIQKRAIVVPSSSGTPVKRLPRPVSKTTVSPGKVKKFAREAASFRSELQELRDEASLLGNIFTKSAEEIMTFVRKEEAENKAKRILQLERRVRELEQENRRVEKEKQEMTEKYLREMRDRRKLLNTVQNLRGNIRVFCRIRPPRRESGIVKGTEDMTAAVLKAIEGTGDDEGPTEVELLKGASSMQRQTTFEFDRVFGEHAGQDEVYESVSSLIQSALDGYNVCIFAYGQTGSGKTYTMEGPQDNPGVNMRALQSLFEKINESNDVTRTIWVSMCEIYNETIRDLLDESIEKKLDVKLAQCIEGFHGTALCGLTTRRVESMKKVADVMSDGATNRHVGATKMNVESSRSHLILTVYITTANQFTGQTHSSKLQLVDLAGSERIKRSQAEGERLKEAQNINRSLSSLGDVVNSLVTKSSHVPYRNSKLTHLLQDSLSGQSKVLMMMCVSPDGPDASESVASLNFAARARAAELGKAKKQIALPAATANLQNGERSTSRPPTPENSSSSLPKTATARPSEIPKRRSSMGSSAALPSSASGSNTSANRSSAIPMLQKKKTKGVPSSFMKTVFDR